jgi:hypothetical protein
MGLKQLGGTVEDLVQRDILQEPRTCCATYFAPEEPLMSKGPTNIGLGLSAALAAIESGNLNRWRYRDVNRTWSSGASERNLVVAVRLHFLAITPCPIMDSHRT